MDFIQPGVFYWDSNGEDVGPYTNWAENQPRETCMTLRYEGGLFKWATELCYLRGLYLCEGTIE